MRMIQAGDCPGLAVKNAMSENGIFGEMRRKNFDGDGAVQTRIACAGKTSPMPPTPERASRFRMGRGVVPEVSATMAWIISP